MKTIAAASIAILLGTTQGGLAKDSLKSLMIMSGTKVAEVKGATRVDIATAKKLHDGGQLFIDTRGSYDFGKGHIPGAVLLSPLIESKLRDVADEERDIVFYCDCDYGSATCNLAPNATALAVSWGYQNVSFFTNYSQWEEAGHALE